MTIISSAYSWMNDNKRLVVPTARSYEGIPTFSVQQIGRDIHIALNEKADANLHMALIKELKSFEGRIIANSTTAQIEAVIEGALRRFVSTGGFKKRHTR